jgi:hypothetical protein
VGKPYRGRTKWEQQASLGELILNIYFIKFFFLKTREESSTTPLGKNGQKADSGTPPKTTMPESFTPQRLKVSSRVQKLAVAKVDSGKVCVL